MSKKVTKAIDPVFTPDQPSLAPVFIIGSGRSGTTLLGRCLGENNTLLFIDEPRFINHILLPIAFDQLNGDDIMRRLAVTDDGSGKEPMKFLRRMNEHYGHLLGKNSFKALEKEVVEGCMDLFTRLPTLSHKQRMQKIRNIIQNLTISTTQLLGGTRWLVKQPDLSCNLNNLLEIFPDARFIHIIRNPFDVIHSRIQRGFQQDFQSAFQVWFNRLQPIAQFNRRVNCMLTISFEDLVNDPERVIRHTADFIGLNPGNQSNDDRSPEDWIVSASSNVQHVEANIHRGKHKFLASENEMVLSAWEELDKSGGRWLTDLNLKLGLDAIN